MPIVRLSFDRLKVIANLSHLKKMWFKSTLKWFGGAIGTWVIVLRSFDLSLGEGNSLMTINTSTRAMIYEVQP